MVVISQPVIDNFSSIRTCKPSTAFFPGVPVVDMFDPDAKARIIHACKEFGFFKVVNHRIRAEPVARLEAQAVKFFSLPQPDKDRAGPPNPFGYGNKRIGPNGDVGWVEYLMFSTNPHLNSHAPTSILPEDSSVFLSAMEEYVKSVKEMCCELLEMISEGLGIVGARDVLSRLLKDEKSDSFFRLNHYPPCPHELQALSGRNLIGFGEHTDPQVISVVRSNNTSGLQIYLKDGKWLSVPPDQHSFFILVGDSLQVLTNGRFRSVRHRVLADSLKSRVSMIYFGGPPLTEKIAPLPSLMVDGEESLYKEFTWCEYKNSAYKTRLGDNRLRFFEKSFN